MLGIISDEWIKKMRSVHTMEYYSAFKKKEILPFETWLSLVGMTLSDTSQTEKDKYSVISLTCGI